MRSGWELLYAVVVKGIKHKKQNNNLWGQVHVLCFVVLVPRAV